MKTPLKYLFSAVIALLVALMPNEARSCTSLIAGAKATADGRPLLWKHRDTGARDNFMERVTPSRGDEIAYVGLFNGGDSLLTEPWLGVNDAGFAIINTASYNLAPDTARVKDREALVMDLALRRCRSVEDFSTLLDTLPRPMGIQTNFGVMDMHGGGGYFEANDEGYTFYPLDAASADVAVRTNFSFSGNDTDGMGYVRFANVGALLEGHDLITPALLTDTLSRSYYNSALGRDQYVDGDASVADRDFIPRAITTASVVIELPKEADADGVCRSRIRAILGYPPVSQAVEFLSDALPESVRPVLPGWHAPLNMEALRVSDTLFQRRPGADCKYIDLNRLRLLRSNDR